MSTRALSRTMIGLTLLGLGVATYLTIAHYSGGTTICPLHGGCETVQHSKYSQLAGVPVALIGLIGYILILGVLLTPSSETTRLIAVVLTVGGFGFSIYLTGRELFSIHAICPWCVSSAIIMTILACLSIWRFLRGEDVPLKSTSQGAGGLDAATASPSSAAEPLPGA
ncbi:MAG TPA: vitamin K epoxide reductase family protein [Solirubrobacteraceae bacterium]